MSSLESTISSYQSAIAGDQQNLSSDQQQVATLNGLSMSMSLALGDIAAIMTALDSLRTTWDVLLGEVGNAAGDVSKAQDAQQAIIAQVWLDAACGAWQAIDGFVEAMQSHNAPVPQMVTIGQ